jgi:hypothetical protein
VQLSLGGIGQLSSRHGKSLAASAGGKKDVFDAA